MKKLTKLVENDYIVRGLPPDVANGVFIYRSFGLIPASKNKFIRALAHLISFLQIALTIFIILIPTLSGSEALGIDASTFYGYFTILMHYSKFYSKIYQLTYKLNRILIRMNHRLKYTFVSDFYWMLEETQ